MIEGAVKRLLAYSRLVHEIVVEGQVDADIHLIHSEGQQEDDDNRDWVGFVLGNSWEAYTRGRHIERQGSGQHMDMLLGEHLKRNAEIIGDILSEVADHIPQSLSAADGSPNKRPASETPTEG